MPGRYRGEDINQSGKLGDFQKFKLLFDGSGQLRQLRRLR